MHLMKLKPDELAEAYRAAYKAANAGGSGYPLWSYSGGWYKIGYGSYRKKQVVTMIENLRKRAQDELRKDQ